MATSPLASAGTCDLTAVDCAAEGASETIGDPTGGAAEEVGSTVDGVNRPLQGVTEPVQDQVDQAVSDASNAVNEVVSSIQDPTSPSLPPDPDGGSSPTGIDVTTTSGSLGSSHRIPSPAGAHAERAGSAPRVNEGPTARPNVPELLSASDQAPLSNREAALTSAASDPSRSLPDNQLLPDDLGKVVFPLLLAAFMLAFLVIQDRLDRSDPKLAKAPMEGDNRLLNFQ